ncbi:DUF1289 domain-containing protein [Silanimonas sp.]|jgi:predicted Fe-S protein YdhL (DUF1289 family)|uniref:DUF1289 domain-containing protein n=1 Tax=Silanimonas sp. TaxID=1929290 RepID=UPI0022BD4461|nr:DUF1289 domain-containing protein [Silanimonas sp.]MCZ8115856.1 DUF1289 domain-containing protein [Silanimonas sp.]
MALPPRRPIDEAPTLASPCVRLCCLDDADECVGCGRTLEEIKAWHGADEAERSRILGAAAARRETRARRFPASR